MRVGRRWHRLPVLCLPVGLHLRLHRGLQPLLLEQALRVHGNGQSESERGRRRPRERARPMERPDSKEAVGPEGPEVVGSLYKAYSRGFRRQCPPAGAHSLPRLLFAAPTWTRCARTHAGALASFLFLPPAQAQVFFSCLRRSSHAPLHVFAGGDPLCVRGPAAGHGWQAHPRAVLQVQLHDDGGGDGV